MAIQKGNLLMQGASGSFNRQITFKQYSGKTVITRYPDMSKVVYTKAQLAERVRFKLAVAYARAVIADPARKKAYSLKKHFSAYHAAIAEYLKNSKAAETSKPEVDTTTTPQGKDNTPARPVLLIPGAEPGYPEAFATDGAPV